MGSASKWPLKFAVTSRCTSSTFELRRKLRTKYAISTHIFSGWYPRGLRDPYVWRMAQCRFLSTHVSFSLTLTCSTVLSMSIFLSLFSVFFSSLLWYVARRPGFGTLYRASWYLNFSSEASFVCVADGNFCAGTDFHKHCSRPAPMKNWCRLLHFAFPAGKNFKGQFQDAGTLLASWNCNTTTTTTPFNVCQARISADDLRNSSSVYSSWLSSLDMSGNWAASLKKPTLTDFLNRRQYR